MKVLFAGEVDKKMKLTRAPVSQDWNYSQGKSNWILVLLFRIFTLS